jgi:diadenosine tetraphosphate (Ap4A) HIT family hydrolase
LPPERVQSRNGSAIAFRDAYPVGPGHTLVIALRHVASFFDTTLVERAAMFSLLEAAKQQLQLGVWPRWLQHRHQRWCRGRPDGGALHIHLIPRHPGDRPDPRGGVRWVIPEKADYWTART